MRRYFVSILCFLFFGFIPDAPIRVFLIGDSTMADKPLIDNPEHGWGQMIPIFFSKNVLFFNHAKNGRSTRSFLYEGKWDVVRNMLRPGDYVFIQFGHNDSKKEDTSRFADPHTDYKEFLQRFIREAKEKKAIPVLLTPVNRRNFDKDGNFVDKHGDYPEAVREIAKNENVPLLDLHKKSKIYFENLGQEESKKLFLTSVKPNVYHALLNGKDDNTHFTRNGAVQIAQLVIDCIREIRLPLEKEIIRDKQPDLIGTGKVVGLDLFYNNEWRKLKDTISVRYHYTWDDTTNSGFSELAKIFDRSGVDTDTLESAPTDSTLRRFSIYIIVDPDTPKETPQPNYLQPKEIDAIERWVTNGGTLVLLGNDKGNCEFEHFNALANRFGIKFNEDLHMDVVNNQYDSGRISLFPNHRMFKNVQYVFIKQLSSLTLTNPAKEILSSRGVTIMAESVSGKGRVFALGDPWLYNEYIDNRRVPKGYENYSAAESFVQWLGGIAMQVR